MGYLKKGDKIALACPGTPAAQGEALATARYLEEAYGFSVIFQKDTYSSCEPRERANIFLQYLFDPSVSLIWQLRGGEGSADIIPWIDQKKDKIRALPQKLLLGFSDFTPILIYFAQYFQWKPIHGLSARQMPLRWVSKESESLTLDWLLGQRRSLLMDQLTPFNEPAKSSLELEATIIGGNLSLMDISIKDIWEIDAKGKIVLIEEVNEKPHRVARLLKYLHRIGIFEKAAAIILAGFNFHQLSAEETRINQAYLQNIFSRFAQQYTFPVFYTDKIGHADDNYPIPFNYKTRLCCGLQPTLQIG